MTIVVPVKNRPTLVVRCLDSIKAQTWRPLRVIVVDNGSTDDTSLRVRAWIDANADEGLQVDLVKESRPGPSAARNAGIREVDSRLMMHFDSDDTMRPGHIENIMRRFAEDDYPDLVCFRVNIHESSGRSRITHSPGGRLMDNHLVHCVLCTAGYAFETALVRRVGGWNENLYGWEDLELGMRMGLEARRRAYIPEVGVDVYVRSDSVTGIDYSTNAPGWERTLDEMQRVLENSRHRKRMRWLRYIDYRRAVLAALYAREGNREAARTLLAKALSGEYLSGLQKRFLRLVYEYTRRGGRGAGIPARFIL